MNYKKTGIILILIITLILFGCTQQQINKDLNEIDSNLPIEKDNNLNQLDSQQEHIKKMMNFEIQKFEIIEELNEKFGSTKNLSLDYIIEYLNKYGVNFCEVLEKDSDKLFCESYNAESSASLGISNEYLCQDITFEKERIACVDKMIILKNVINYFKIYKEDVNSAYNKVNLPLKAFDFSNCSRVSKENLDYCKNPFLAVSDGIYKLKYYFLMWVEYE